MNDYRKVKVEKPEFVWRKSGGCETGNKFNRPTKDRRYVKILALCLVPCPAKTIYPDVKNPLMHQVRDMCRAGLLDRLTDGRRYYYQTTQKGRDLILEALEAK